ncbi:MAG TPA: HIT domain-containing protein [Candidatus Saccharimonadales bacterium]|jgi:histidine triad (HIT) family protein
MNDCIFCQIVEGKAPSQQIYSDDKTLAFLSIQPVRPGHTLIIPKTHEPDIFSLTEEDYLAIMKTAYKLTPVLKDVYKPERVGLLVAGWEVPHAHLHLVPMLEHDDLTSKRLLDGTAKFVDQKELEKEQAQIVAKLKA